MVVETVVLSYRVHYSEIQTSPQVMKLTHCDKDKTVLISIFVLIR